MLFNDNLLVEGKHYEAKSVSVPQLKKWINKNKLFLILSYSCGEMYFGKHLNAWLKVNTKIHFKGA